MCVLLFLSLLACGDRVEPSDDDNDGWMSNVDCNDDNPFINPAADEIPGDGVNNDCNLDTRDDDYDQDGLVGMEDCDDRNADVPGPEVPYDGIDNDCDPSTRDDDLDDDGVNGDEDCDDEEPLVRPGLHEVPYDGLDNDCDPLTSDADRDGDGVLPPEDCDDDNPDVQGPAAWYADCDGDFYAPVGAESVFACQPPEHPSTCPLGFVGAWTTIAPTGLAASPSNDRIDCADRDPDAYPGQTAWFTQPVHESLPYDFDCDGLQTPEYGPYTCERIGSTSSCTVTEGFLDPMPACGEQGIFSATCLIDLDTCIEAFESVETLRCR